MPHLHHLLAHVEGVIEFGAGEAFRRVFQHDVGFTGQQAQVVDHHLGAVSGDFFNPVTVLTKDHPALQFGGRIVQVNDATRGPDQRLTGPLDQLRAGLGQHLDAHVVGHFALVDDLADKVKVGVRSRRKANFDLFEPHPNQGFEHAMFARRVHRVDERLIPVAQVNRAPSRGAVDDFVRPCAIGQFDRLESPILVCWHLIHGSILSRAPGRPVRGFGRRTFT